VNITKRFGTFVALDGVSLEVRPGTVHALLGENGAGKTTLMRIAYGLVRPDSGTMRVDGAPAAVSHAADAIALGIGMVHQHFTLVPVMTIAENVALGNRGLLRISRAVKRVRELVQSTGFALDPLAKVETLSVGAQQRVEITKALAHNARVLILDEPTAVLAPEESKALLDWLRAFADAGNAVVLITHKLRDALNVADDVTVLRHGRTTLARRASMVTTDELADAMLGKDVSVAEYAGRLALEGPTDAPVVFRAERLRVTDSAGVTRVHDATFVVRAGEVVGVAGVEGSGHRELLRSLAGRVPPVAGTLTRPADVGFVPEDRHRDAVLLDRDLAANMILRGAGARRGMIDWQAAWSDTRAILEEYDVRVPSTRAALRMLSGGNQQKIVVARELRAARDDRPHAIVAENPTRGLDVRAAAAIHGRLRQASEKGAAVVIYSNDIDEILSLATRVFVTHAGSVIEVALDRDTIGRTMLGAS